MPSAATKCNKNRPRAKARAARLDHIFTTPPQLPLRKRGGLVGRLAVAGVASSAAAARVAEGDLKWATPLGPCAPGFDH